MSRVAFLLMLARVCSVVIECLLVDCFPVFPSCVLPRLPLEDDASLRSTTPSVSSSHQVRGAYIMLITFSSIAPRCRIEQLLDPTTSYSCLLNKAKQPCPPHPSKPLFGHVPCLLNHCLVCMLRMPSTVIMLLLGLGYHIIILLWMI